MMLHACAHNPTGVDPTVSCSMQNSVAIISDIYNIFRYNIQEWRGEGRVFEATASEF